MTIISIGWYRPERWQRLREISVDKEQLEDTHEEWLRSASKTVKDLRRMGVSVQKIDVDVEDLLTWCKERGLSVDGDARAKYIAYKTEQTNAAKK